MPLGLFRGRSSSRKAPVTGQVVRRGTSQPFSFGLTAPAPRVTERSASRQPSVGRGTRWAPCGTQMRSVKVAASPLGPSIPGATAYHTSLVLDGVEYSFSGRGISMNRGIQSHNQFKGHPTLIDFGFTTVPPERMLKVLRPHFREGTYDLLRKNCNTFSDCAVSMLVNKRLDTKYRAAEKLGKKADTLTNLVKIISGGGYQPNQAANCWDTQVVNAQIRDAHEIQARRGAEARTEN